MPSHSPTRAVTAGLRSVEVKSSSRGRRGARISGAASTQDGEPAAVVLVGRVDAEPGRGATSCADSGPRTVHGNGSERWPPHSSSMHVGRVARCPAVRRRRRPGRRARAARRPGAAGATGSPPMPMLPSASSAQVQRPSPGRWSNTSRCRALAPRARVWATASGRRRCPARRPPGGRGARSSGPGRSRCRAPGRSSVRAAPRRRRRPGRPTGSSAAGAAARSGRARCTAPRAARPRRTARERRDAPPPARHGCTPSRTRHSGANRVSGAAPRRGRRRVPRRRRAARPWSRRSRPPACRAASVSTYVRVVDTPRPQAAGPAPGR